MLVGSAAGVCMCFVLFFSVWRRAPVRKSWHACKCCHRQRSVLSLVMPDDFFPCLRHCTPSPACSVYADMCDVEDATTGHGQGTPRDTVHSSTQGQNIWNVPEVAPQGKGGFGMPVNLLFFFLPMCDVSFMSISVREALCCIVQILLIVSFCLEGSDFGDDPSNF